MVKQPSIFFKINQENRDFDSRYLKIHRVRKIIENLLKSGFTPYELEEESIEPIKVNDNNTAFSALDFALELKKNSVSDKTFIDYKHRISKFKKHLKDRYLNDIPIKNITKKDINDFLNSVLVNSSPRNRNNTLTVLNAIFSTLEENELIEYNVVSKIKKIQAKPERNKTYTQTQQDEIFTLMEQEVKDLLLFVKFISYNFLRPVEVCRLQVKDIDFEGAKLNVRAKNKLIKVKIIPELLLQEIQFIFGSCKMCLCTYNGVDTYTTILPFGFSFLEWISICFQGKRKTKGEKTSELSFFCNGKIVLILSYFIKKSTLVRKWIFL